MSARLVFNCTNSTYRACSALVALGEFYLPEPSLVELGFQYRNYDCYLRGDLCSPARPPLTVYPTLILKS